MLFFHLSMLFISPFRARAIGPYVRRISSFQSDSPPHYIVHVRRLSVFRSKIHCYDSGLSLLCHFKRVYVTAGCYFPHW